MIKPLQVIIVLHDPVENRSRINSSEINIESFNYFHIFYWFENAVKCNLIARFQFKTHFMLSLIFIHFYLFIYKLTPVSNFAYGGEPINCPKST